MALRLAAAVALAAYASRALAVALPSPPPSPPPDTLDDGSPASVTVECNNAVLAGGRMGNFCNSIVSGTPPGTPVSNVDPPWGSYFPSDSLFPDFTAGISSGTVGYGNGMGSYPEFYYNPFNPQASFNFTNLFVGTDLVPQVGWGGGLNVSLGPPMDSFVWGVHATVSNAPTPVGTVAVQISWQIGRPSDAPPDATLAAAGAPCSGPCLGNLVDVKTPVGYVPLGLTTSFTFTGLPAPTVTPVCFKYLRKYPLWGRFTDSHGNVGPAGSAAPTCQAVVPAVPLYYNQPTAWPGADGSCFINASSAACASCSADSNAGVPFPYVSPLICHATFVGLAPNTVIEYTISGVVDGVAYTTSAKQIRGGLFSLKTPSTPDAPAYPLRWGLLGDPGQTFNSSLTANYIADFAPSVVLHMGDFTYADDFGANSTFFGDPNVGGSNGLKWDSWTTMFQPLLGHTLVIATPGNHEMEANLGYPYNPVKYTDTAANFGFNSTNGTDGRAFNLDFQAYASRFPSGAVGPSDVGDVYSALWFAQVVGPVQLIVLNNYVPFAVGTDQYRFFVSALASVNRTATPWLIVFFHTPPYHSYYTHYKEMDCFLSIYEKLFFDNAVNFVINGHVHAYERTHPLYQYERNDAGPVYLVLGDGGNIEGPYRSFVDDQYPGTNQTFCVHAWGAKNFSTSATPAGGFVTAPSYQLAPQPPSLVCDAQSFQPANGVNASIPGQIVNPNDPTGTTFWCQGSQPYWSAYRDPSFGFGSFVFESDTVVHFSWYRNVDQTPGAPLVAVDTATYTRTIHPTPPSPPPAPFGLSPPFPPPGNATNRTVV